MALLVAGDFSGFSATYAVPADFTGSLYNGSVDLTLINECNSKCVWFIIHSSQMYKLYGC